MRRIFLVLVFCLLFCVSAFSQEAKKIDEFGDIHCDDLKARIDYLLTEIETNKNSKGYVFVYEGKVYSPIYNENRKRVLPRVGEANTRIELLKKYFKFRQYSLKNLVFVNGGFRENLIIEFWIVPQNAEIPKASPTLEKLKHRKGKAPKLIMGDC